MKIDDITREMLPKLPVDLQMKVFPPPALMKIGIKTFSGFATRAYPHTGQTAEQGRRRTPVHRPDSLS
ncbi:MULTISPECIES: hypothetical protein [Stenotrophomonas maltophilia group]|uniref:hypothetical protein n=1 Tax=Stenotrophomonas maltophilia group TaxID=995085 RepID=UPI0018D3E090|nr:hypothetical protein [Stenotrophomonas maltophilia]HDS1298837.1 hypothetical protein [Stenotrophomonas maltophilia]HDS1523935.1 hypothetical protein [Stenotrophomonas maltophilia]HDS1658774.1 hypothetical protein [Stenotrophomonas maltophilia]HDS1672657.1 hypothetical protein [Stenotrophomonas maltophilia]